MVGSYLSEFDSGTTMKELLMFEAKGLIHNSKTVQAEYRRSAEISKLIYDLAWDVLQQTLGAENISLPIDVRKVANKLGFVVSCDNFSDVELDYILNDHDCLPIAQLKMRRKRVEHNDENICGTIRVAKYLNENATRFSVAHELGHVVLRHQNPIGASVIREACPGMYPMVDTEEMLSDLFAQALLLPYRLFKQEREEYEKDRTHWPLDFSMWIKYIRSRAQIPEYQAVIAFQELKKLDIIERMERAEKLFKKIVLSMANPDSEQEQQNSYPAIKSLYANTIFNLEGWGFSSEQVADILFKGEKWEFTKDSAQERRDVVSILHDHKLRNMAVKRDDSELRQCPDQNPPLAIQRCVFDALLDAGLSESGIEKITELKNINLAENIQ